MPAPGAISADKLVRLIGTHRCPGLHDVRAETARAADPRLVASARPLGETEIRAEVLARLAAGMTGLVVGICAEGRGRGQGAAAALRGAGIAPEAAELPAASLGLSRMYADDLDQRVAGLALCDAFYRWARDATDETHNWPTNRPGGAG